jgi:hypothetical protein
VIKQLGAQPVHLSGDRFKAKEKLSSTSTRRAQSKPTAAQMRARRANIKKAQAARWKRR